MNTLKILYHLIIVTTLVFITTMFYITIYTKDWVNRIVYIYDNLKEAELEYYNN